MAKKAARKKDWASTETGAERARRVEKLMIARAVRDQRRIRDLSRQLINATVSADVALRAVVRMGIERMPELPSAAAAPESEQDLDGF